MDYFEFALSKDSFPLPLLFYGSDGAILERKAVEGAEKILKGKTDLLVVRPDPKSFTFVFATLKESLETLSLSPYEGRYKVLILVEIEKMLPIHSSLLLKTLEEKPPYSILFLTTPSTDLILPTILSRSIKIFVQDKGGATPLKEFIPPLIESSFSKDYRKFFTLLEDLYPKVETQSALEEIFFLTLAFYRDLEIVRNNERHPLVFEDGGPIFTKLLSYRTPSYTELLTKIESAELAFRNHTKVKSILEYFFTDQLLFCSIE